MRSEQLRTGGGQLDRQRQAVKPATELNDVDHVLRCDVEARPHHPSAPDEELHRT